MSKLLLLVVVIAFEGF